MKDNLLPIILVAASWTSTGCSSSGESRTTAPALPQNKQATSAVVNTKLTKPQVNPNLLLRRRVLDLFQQEKFSELDGLLESFQHDFEKDFRKELVLEEAFGAFSAYDSAMESRLHKWVQQSPQSYSALLARASYFLSRAWASRGTRWAKDTSSTQFVHMELNLANAGADVAAALKLKGELIVGFDLLMSIEMAAPTSGSDLPLVERALANWPNSFLIRKAYMHRLKPRWGGSYEEMQAFANVAQTYAQANPRLKFLPGLMYVDQGQMLSHDKHFEQAVQAHTQALSYGDYWQFRYERADTYWRMNRYPEALEDINRAIALYPQAEDNYVLRSKILFEMDRFSEGIGDLWTAQEIWPYEDSVQEWVRGAAIHLVYDGHQFYKQNQYAPALERFNLAAECDPSHSEIYYWRGVLFAGQGNLSEAQQDLERAVRLNPRHFQSYRSLDWVLAKQGKWDAVVEHWNQFLALEPNHAKAYLERGGTFYHKGDLKSAFQDAQKACQLGEQEACARSESLKQRIWSRHVRSGCGTTIATSSLSMPRRRRGRDALSIVAQSSQASRPLTPSLGTIPGIKLNHPRCFATFRFYACLHFELFRPLASLSRSEILSTSVWPLSFLVTRFSRQLNRQDRSSLDAWKVILGKKRTHASQTEDDRGILKFVRSCPASGNGTIDRRRIHQAEGVYIG